MSNVYDIQTGEQLKVDILEESVSREAAPVCEAVRRYREEQACCRREPGWPEAFGMAFILSLLGVF
jgi:hypothetical protein